MKREICCRKCADDWRRTMGPHAGDSAIDAAQRAEERLKIVSGEALRPCVCDGCNRAIEPGEQCYAVSLYTAETIPYFEWEDGYILVGETPEVRP